MEPDGALDRRPLVTARLPIGLLERSRMLLPPPSRPAPLQAPSSGLCSPSRGRGPGRPQHPALSVPPQAAALRLERYGLA